MYNRKESYNTAWLKAERDLAQNSYDILVEYESGVALIDVETMPQINNNDVNNKPVEKNSQSPDLKEHDAGLIVENH